MSKNIKIGKKTFTGVKYISCASADEEGVQRKFVDEDSAGSGENKFLELIKDDSSVSTGTIDLTADDFNGVTKIRQYAFYHSKKIKTLTLPSSVTEIGKSAFSSCTNLETINLSNVEILRGGCFSYCTKLTEFYIPDTLKTVEIYPFDACYNLKSMQASSLKKILSIRGGNFPRVDNIYIGNESSPITDVVVPDDVTFVCAAFRGYKKLNSVVIGDNVVGLEGNAFDGCTNLTSVTFGENINLNEISFAAFRDCRSLSSLTIPASVTSIGANALAAGSSTNKLTVTMLPTTPPTLDNNSIYFSCLNKIIVPAGCGEAYKAATNWAAYADYIEEATAE